MGDDPLERLERLSRLVAHLSAEVSAQGQVIEMLLADLGPDQRRRLREVHARTARRIHAEQSRRPLDQQEDLEVLTLGFLAQLLKSGLSNPG